MTDIIKDNSLKNGEIKNEREAQAEFNKQKYDCADDMVDSLRYATYSSLRDILYRYFNKE
jgi:hypothetical protein